MILLDVQKICKSQPDRKILNSISFQQNKFEKIAITGESGSGKSTLLKIISGLIQSDGGNVFFQGEKVAGPEEKLLAGHPDIAYLSQHYELHNNYFVKDLLFFRMRISEKEANEMTEVCRISHLLDRKTNHLSGGEKQRIALCLLLVKYPLLLVLDEPFSNLDLISKNILKTVLEDLTDRLQITCLLASHDPQDTLSWAEKIIVMKDGGIVQEGTPGQIYNEPADQYAAGLFGKFTLLSPRQAAILRKETRKELIVRPENFRLSNHLGAKGQIKKITFWGTYFELEIVIQDFIILTQVIHNEWTVGEEVYVQYDQ